VRRPAAAAAGVALALVLVGCASTSVPPARTRPNAVELAAVDRTATAFNAAVDPSLPWVQLWTSNQFPTQLKKCVGEQSLGQLGVDVQLPLLRRLSYGIIGSGSQPNEAEASRIIERCAAATPLDDRVLRVPENEWQALYSYDLTTLKPCLVEHGFAVGSVPDRREFEGLLRAQHPWSPYDAVTVRSRAAWYRIADACPALPATVTVRQAPATPGPFPSN
jgi:hypothetical protein